LYETDTAPAATTDGAAASTDFKFGAAGSSSSIASGIKHHGDAWKSLRVTLFMNFYTLIFTTLFQDDLPVPDGCRPLGLAAESYTACGVVRLCGVPLYACVLFYALFASFAFIKVGAVARRRSAAVIRLNLPT
jgi:hypothetical protein